MKYLTDRKRAVGLGSGREGTHHHWQMLVTSIAMVVAVPVFVLVFGSGLGGDRGDVLTFFSRPGIAILTGLSMVVIVIHTMNEVIEAVEDYVHGVAGKLTLVGVRALAYVLIAIGLFAIAKIAI